MGILWAGLFAGIPYTALYWGSMDGDRWSVIHSVSKLHKRLPLPTWCVHGAPQRYSWAADIRTTRWAPGMSGQTCRVISDGDARPGRTAHAP